MYSPSRDSEKTNLNPVECISWYESHDALKLVGLTIPTEAQWEYAARAGTTTPWWCGPELNSDDPRFCLMRSTHAPISEHWHVSNGFGLVDTIGNVWEWCLDDYTEYSARPVDATGRRVVDLPRYKPSRGGSYFNDAQFARASIRYYRTVPEARFNNRGVRAARLIDGMCYEL